MKIKMPSYSNSVCRGLETAFNFKAVPSIDEKSIFFSPVLVISFWRAFRNAEIDPL